MALMQTVQANKQQRYYRFATRRRVTRPRLHVRYLSITGCDRPLKCLAQQAFHSETAAISAHLTPASLHGRLMRLRQARRKICSTAARACALYTSSPILAIAARRPLSMWQISSGHLLQYGDGLLKSLKGSTGCDT